METLPFQFEKGTNRGRSNPYQSLKLSVAQFCQEKQLKFEWFDKVSREQGHCKIDGRQTVIKPARNFETKGSIIVTVDSSAKLELAIKEMWFILLINPDTGTMVMYSGEQFTFEYIDRKIYDGKYGKYFFLDLPQEAVAFKVGSY